MSVTQDEINVAKQRKRTLFCKIDLLNYSMQKVDELSGVVVGNPSFTNDSTSDIRRKCNLSMFVKDKSFDIMEGNKIWFDKYLKIYIGILNNSSGNIVYTNMGVYIINNPERAYSATDNTLTIECLDLMAKLTGLRNGNLEGLTYQIPQGSNVRQAMIATLLEAGFNNYILDECPYDVPNDININAGGTAYDILVNLRDICPNYQIYFDVNGNFIYRLIPSGDNEQIMVDDNLWKDVLISYDQVTDFESLKNYIEVYGKTHDIDNYGTATLSSNIYSVTISTVTVLTDNLKIGFTITQEYTGTNPQLNINSYGAKLIKNEDGTIPSLTLDSGTTSTYYVVRYSQSNGYFIFLGHITPQGFAQDDNYRSQFYVNGSVGKIRKVLNGGEYDNIYSDDLAEQRAQWELYTRCKLLDSINIVCVPVYWLDTNWLISITLPNKQGTEEPNLYLIKQIDTEYGVDSTQKINLMRYYPYYQG